MLILNGYNWPGNVRELRHIIELALALSQGALVEADAITAALSHRRHELDAIAQQTAELQTLLDQRRQLAECLERHGWHVPSAARELCVTKKTVYARIQKLGISIPRRYQRRCPPTHPSVELRAV